MNISEDSFSRLRIVILTFNARRYLDDLLPALQRQLVLPESFLFVDSSSTDGTQEVLRNAGFSVLSIPQSEFNHGGTRRMAAELCKNSEFLIFATQDAIPLGLDSYTHLLTAFEDAEVGLAYGRQLPRPQARAIERHARLLNYPAESGVRSFEDRSRLGVKTTFCSDSFAAYRRSALMAVGNFPEDALFGEDQIIAGRMLINGYKVAYVAEAQVTHSHGYSISQDFKRYFDIGVFHGRNPWLKSTFGRAEGEGLRFVFSELSYVLRHEPAAGLSVVVRTFAKYLAYRIGRMERHLSASCKRRLSMSAYYWR